MTLKQSKIAINLLSMAGVLLAMLTRSTTASVIAVVLCAFAALGLFYQNAAQLSGIAEENPKTGVLKKATVFTVAYFAALVAFSALLNALAKQGVLDPLLAGLTPLQLNMLSKLLMAALSAVPMAVIGNMAPQLPFQRYTGLRLPWTVRDEETWLIAHRLLGYLSFPIAVLLFAAVPTPMPLQTYVEFWWCGALLLWIGIPGMVSGLFFYRKYKG